MGLTRTMRAAAVIAGAVATGLAAMPQTARASEIADLLTPGSVRPVQLLGPQRALTEEEAAALLESEGFEVVEMGRTLLGRIRIVAEGPQGSREIVLHPGDGRVLRDIFTEAERPTAVIVQAVPSAPAAVEAQVVGTEVPVQEPDGFSLLIGDPVAEPDAPPPEPAPEVGEPDAPVEVTPDPAP